MKEESSEGKGKEGQHIRDQVTVNCDKNKVWKVICGYILCSVSCPRYIKIKQ